MKNPHRTTFRGGVILTRMLFLILFVAAGPWVGASEEHAEAETGQASHDAHGTKGLHEVMIFLGATDDRGEWANTWGAEYGYSFMDNYAAGVFLDRAEGQLRSSVVGLAFWAHVVKGLGLMFGPGVEFLDEAQAEEAGDESQGEEGSKRQFLARVGLGYSFHVGERYVIFPVVHADFVEEHIVWVTGVNFGIRFGKKAH
jgi:hypothetical protein